MQRINWPRVLLGGLLAGFVANVLQFTLNRLYLFRAWDTATVALGDAIARRSEHRPELAMMTFLGSFLAIWLYAMIRDRFGSGPKTAALAGGIFWLMSWFFPVVLWSLSGPFPALPSWLLAAHLTTYLGIAIVATMVGARQYREYREEEKESVAKA